MAWEHIKGFSKVFELGQFLLTWQSPPKYSLGSGTNKTLVKKPVVSPANFYFDYKVCKTAEKEKKISPDNRMKILFSVRNA